MLVPCINVVGRGASWNRTEDKVRDRRMTSDTIMIDGPSEESEMQAEIAQPARLLSVCWAVWLQQTLFVDITVIVPHGEISL